MVDDNYLKDLRGTFPEFSVFHIIFSKLAKLYKCIIIFSFVISFAENGKTSKESFRSSMFTIMDFARSFNRKIPFTKDIFRVMSKNHAKN
jgi:hypothetical protein